MTRRTAWRTLAVCWWLCVGLPPVQATPPTWWVQPAIETCEALGVPGVLAVAVILTESGGHPYAIRVNQGPARAVFPSTYAAGVQMVARAVQTTPNTDIGLMQVNYQTWGPRLGLAPAQLLHPTVNLWAGCTVLWQALAARGDLWQQIGRYHSPTPARQHAYTRKIVTWLTRLTR